MGTGQIINLLTHLKIGSFEAPEQTQQLIYWLMNVNGGETVVLFQ